MVDHERIEKLGRPQGSEPGAARAEAGERKTTPQLLSHLRALEIRLWEEDGELRLKGPKAAMTPVLRTELAERKAEILAFLGTAAGQSPSAAIPRIPRDRDVPLSFGQQRLWVLDRFEPGNPAYNMSQPLRLKGPLQTAVLMRCFHEIIRRHEILRTSFASIDGEPVQRIAPAPVLSFLVVDLSALPELRRRAEAGRLAAAEAGRPFELTTAPLARFTLVRQSPEEHLLVTTLHHIISDGWSNNILISELIALYQAFVASRPSPLPELPIQYADFAGWQRQWLRGEVLEGQLSYWRQRLAGAPDLLELPANRPRPATQTYRGELEALALPNSLSGTLRALCREHKATLFMALLAAFQTLLFRYTGSRVIVVGCPIAGRNRGEIEGLIGFFVNTLALDAELSARLSFRELLEQVRRVTLGAYAHQDLPFEKLVDELQPERNMSHTPLFQVCFALQDAPHFVRNISDLTLILEAPEKTPAKFDLTLDMWETDDGLRGALNYNVDLFDRTTIRRMARHFENLLEYLVAHPDGRLGKAPLLTRSAEQQILREWNDTRVDYPRDTCVHELFEHWAEATPEAPALVLDDGEWSYRRLNRRANRLAHHLREQGVGPEVLVATCLERSAELVATLLAILKAGGAYVPLEPGSPPERLQALLRDARPAIVVTRGVQLEGVETDGVRRVDLDRDRDLISRSSEENPSAGAVAENLAYVIYTSGSTGEPKGVSIPHRGVMRLVRGANYAELSAAEVFLQLAPTSFDASTLELWGSLLHGARLAIPQAQAPALSQLARILERFEVSTLWLTAGLFHLMVDEHAAELKTVRQLLAGGDVLSVPHVRKLLAEPGAQVLINGYGPTENTTFTCCHPLRRSSRVESSVPIGRPIANTAVHVFDRDLTAVPIGVAGELHVAGDGLARAYLDRPGLSAEKFIPHPLSREGGARLYRTGDRVRLLADGTIEFLGRFDYQVKIRGFRIEPAEIEVVLGRHPAVREAVVVARQGEGAGADKQLAAFLVAEPGTTATVEELSRFLRSKLPGYMVPACFVTLEELPLNPNGKVDRAALAVAGGSKLESEVAFVAPRNQLERQLAEIWGELLGEEAIGIYDDFFDRGGNSLLATQVVSRVRDLLQVEVPLANFFEASTVAGLAESVEVARRSVDDLHKQRPTAAAGREVGEL